MLTTSNSSSDGLSDGGYGGLSWQVNKSLTNEDLSSLKSKDITVTYTWEPSSAVMGEVAVTAWVCSTNVMGWRWSDSGKNHFDVDALRMPVPCHPNLSSILMRWHCATFSWSPDVQNAIDYWLQQHADATLCSLVSQSCSLLPCICTFSLQFWKLKVVLCWNVQVPLHTLVSACRKHWP